MTSPKSKVWRPRHWIVSTLDNGLIQLSKQAIVSPIRTVEFVYKEFPSIFAELCGTRRLEQFWNSVHADDPQLILHPMVGIKDWQNVQCRLPFMEIMAGLFATIRIA